MIMLCFSSNVFCNIRRKAFTFAVVILLFIFVGIFLKFSLMRKANYIASAKLSSALTHILHGDHERGLDIIDKIILQFSNTPSAYYGKLVKSDILVDKCMYNEALKILNEILNNSNNKKVPDMIKPLVSSRIIHIYDYKKDYFSAIVAAKEFINKYPNHFLSGDICLNLAEHYVQIGFKNEAINILNNMLIKFPKVHGITEIVRSRLNYLTRGEFYGKDLIIKQTH
ncbi:MAG: hypothetical protein LBC05_01000 [Endomicrobium sp.]|nr:hypothetical protein [Endomicrobium sp.]